MTTNRFSSNSLAHLMLMAGATATAVRTRSVAVAAVVETMGRDCDHDLVSELLRSHAEQSETLAEMRDELVRRGADVSDLAGL